MGALCRINTNIQGGRMQTKDINKLQNKLVGYAMEIAEKCGYQLNYSNQSIKDVDKILGLLHKEYKATGFKEGMDGSCS